MTNILGTDYEIILDSDITSDGICDFYAKTIRIRNPQDMLEPEDDIHIKFKRFNEVMRHEIIHAFLHESGMDKYDEDEEIVSWFAIQFPKMDEMFHSGEFQGWKG